MTVRVGVSGCGYFGGWLARILNDIEGAEVAAVFGGGEAEPLAAELQCRLAQSMEELVRMPDVDAVIVASPSHLHKEQTMLAARHGKHVFCEKPAALSLRDCEEMIAACREHNVVLMAGHIYRFMNGVRQAKAWIDAGVIGRPVMAHSERTGWEDPKPHVSWKKMKTLSGGHLFHHIHEIDLLQALLGPARAVVTAGGKLALDGDGFGDEDDILLLTLQFDGAVGSMQYGSGFRWGGHYTKINGTEGSILFDMEKSKVYLKTKEGLSEHLMNDTADEDRERAEFYTRREGAVVYGNSKSNDLDYMTKLMRREMAAFRDAAAGKPIAPEWKELFDGTAARSSVATAEAAMTALAERRWIAIS